MDAEQIEWLRGYARTLDCKLVLEGQVGFGRECVGIHQTEEGMFSSWLNYGWYGFAGDEEANKKVNQIVRACAPEDAYHKDDFVCVLGEGFAALEQLYDWCIGIEKAGLRTELVYEPDLGPGTSTMSMIATGQRAQVRKLVLP